MKNGNETDVDCGGGTCTKCADTLTCAKAADCVSGVCSAGKCAKATCTDKVKNGSETDVDCGGSCGGTCANGKKCVKGADCVGLVCKGGLCAAASCTDKVKNGNETDVDCGGGTCAKCGAGKACKASTDCAPGVCQTSACRYGLSCKEILDKKGSSGSGVYWVKPKGSSSAFKIYCDMTSNGGGWTLVVGINGSDHNHVYAGARTPQNLTSAGGKGKLADSVINALKSGGNPAFRMTCKKGSNPSLTGYFQSSCTFDAYNAAKGGCVAISLTYPPSAYKGTYSQGGHTGVADGTRGSSDRLIYGRHGGPTGCDTYHHWYGNGTLWVR